MSDKVCPECGKHHNHRSQYCCTQHGRRGWQKKHYQKKPKVWRVCAYPGCKKGEDGKPKKFLTQKGRCCCKACGVMLYNTKHPEKVKNWVNTYLRKKVEAVKKQISV